MQEMHLEVLLIIAIVPGNSIAPSISASPNNFLKSLSDLADK